MILLIKFILVEVLKRQNFSKIIYLFVLGTFVFGKPSDLLKIFKFLQLRFYKRLVTKLFRLIRKSLLSPPPFEGLNKTLESYYNYSFVSFEQCLPNLGSTD